MGGLAAHVQMAINEQTKKSKVLYISTSQSDEITAKPDASPITFHEALNPTITCRVVGNWVGQNLGKKWWIIYADYAWGKQCSMVFQDSLKRRAAPCSGPPRTRSAAPSSPRTSRGSRRPSPTSSSTWRRAPTTSRCLKQVASFGMRKT